jgi:hypothetical protein
LAENSETVGEVGVVEMVSPPPEMGVVDPETLYTKQNCIGMLYSFPTGLVELETGVLAKDTGENMTADTEQAGAALARSIKGMIAF